MRTPRQIWLLVILILLGELLLPKRTKEDWTVSRVLRPVDTGEGNDTEILRPGELVLQKD